MIYKHPRGLYLFVNLAGCLRRECADSAVSYKWWKGGGGGVIKRYPGVSYIFILHTVPFKTRMYSAFNLNALFKAGCQGRYEVP